MAASSNPTEGSSAAEKISSSAAAATNGGAVNSVENGGMDNSETISALRHNPGISVDWTLEEQSLLEDLLAKYSLSLSTCIFYMSLRFRFEVCVFCYLYLTV